MDRAVQDAEPHRLTGAECARAGHQTHHERITRQITSPPQSVQAPDSAGGVVAEVEVLPSPRARGICTTTTTGNQFGGARPTERRRGEVNGMTAAPNDAVPGQRSVLADRVSRVVTSFNAFLTLIALGYGIYTMFQATPEDLIVNAWRTFGFLVFFSLWVLVTVWPRQVPGAWELIFVHKVAITVFALTLGNVPGARETALVDGWLVLSGVLAYVLCRGWSAWRPLSRGRADAGNPVGSRA
ncbi:hypothetical protein [Kineococcus radiotolerans]|uniref:hypothetical protein n=1 Tax=Kineococcus radiotolerans TaxID=131568 RepID=UPI00003A3B6D|nr:hypothetical protein [Kineococcus radiotolerans]